MYFLGECMKYIKFEKEITMDIFARLTEIFAKKKWEINIGEDELSLFNRYCIMLSQMTRDEQILILELTENFIIVSPDKYMHYLSNILNDFVKSNKEMLKEIKNIYIAPLIAPKDFGENKSSTFVQYLMQACIFSCSELANKKCVYTKELEVDKDLINTQDSLLLLVDDFIGTGGTANEVIEYLTNEKEIKKSKISILTIAILEIGESRIMEMEVDLYYSIKTNKGITDNYTDENLSEKVSLMDGIEKKIKVHRKEKFGYDRSEALITLVRTPNNVFPVFWKNKNGARIAPFSR